MKTTFALLALVAASSLPLLGCEAADNHQAVSNFQPAEHEVYIGGNATGDRVVQVPADRTVVDNDQPYALRGDQPTTPPQQTPSIGFNGR